MKKIIPILLIVGLVLFSFVNAQIGIYVSIGEPKITSLTYSLEGVDNNGLDLTVKNIGKETGSFQVTVSCSHNWETDWYRSSDRPNFNLGAGDTKTIRIPLSCYAGEGENINTKCFGSVNCEVEVEDVEGSFMTGEELKDIKTIGFQAQKPSYCGTSYGWCKKGELRCDDKKLMKCNDYCDSYDLVKECGYKCGWKEGEYRCISLNEERAEKTKNNLITFGFIGGFIAIIIFLVWLLNKLKGKKVHFGKTETKKEEKESKKEKGKFCGSCGAKVETNSKFCKECGKKV